MDFAGKPLSRVAFTLTELLVALTIVATLGSLAMMMLTTTSRVSDEITPARDRSRDAFLSQVQFELDHLLPNPMSEDFPPLSLKDGETLSFSTERPNGPGTRLPIILTYTSDGTQILRIEQQPFTGLSVTNRIDRPTGPVSFRVGSFSANQTDWPAEGAENPLPPALLQIRVDDTSSPALLYIPASHTAASSSSSEED